jgi:hypothetical protein
MFTVIEDRALLTTTTGALVRGANIVREELGLPESYIPATDPQLSMVPLTKG